MRSSVPGHDGGMSDSPPAPVERGELLMPGSPSQGRQDGRPDERPETEAVESPAKVMRIGTMVKQLLDEVRAAPLDERSRERLTRIYQTSVSELAEALSPDLQEELHQFVLPFDGQNPPSDAELRIAQAQLVGWLEGLFHGIQATLFAQQLAAQQQLQQMRQLPSGVIPRSGPPPGGPDEPRPGTYL
jgi:Bacterial proteasome activator